MIELKNINKRYHNDPALVDINISFPDTGFVSIVGESGCGKSTLLNVIGGIEEDYDGAVFYNDKKVKKLSSYTRVTYIFQSYHLIFYLTCLHNIQLYDDFHKTIFPNHFPIEEFKHTSISKLSLGQRQRVGIYRALYPEPAVLLCDEPTASLDQNNREYVMKELKEISKTALVIFVSHDMKLVQRFSDAIYQMEDGEIVREEKIDTSPVSLREPQKKRHPFSILKLTLLSLKAHKNYCMKMCLALSVSMLAIMLTFTLSFSLRDHIMHYIDSLLPSSTISYKSNESLDFSKIPSIKHSFLYTDDYELLGLSCNKEHYLKNETLFISDETGYGKNIIKGREATNNHEAVLPYTTAKHLSRNNDVSSVLDKTYYAYYKHLNSVRGVELKIVGIDNSRLENDAIYLYKNANIENLKEIFGTEIRSTLGILYFEGNPEDVLHTLKKTYPQAKFKVVGEKTKNAFNQTMDRIELILVIISCFALFSALFMIGEIIYLLVVSSKKDYAIEMCFGAKRTHIIKQVIYTALFIVFVSLVFSLIDMSILITVLNRFIIPLLINASFVIAVPLRLIAACSLGSILFVLLASFISIIHVYRMNIAEALKG